MKKKFVLIVLPFVLDVLETIARRTDNVIDDTLVIGAIELIRQTFLGAER